MMWSSSGERDVAVVRQERAQTTRDAIIRGAAEIFESYGYGSASLSDIVQRSGVTKGSLYFHFASKEALAHAVIEEQHAIAFATGQVPSSPGGSAIEAMIGMSRRFGEQLLTEPIVRAGIRLTMEASMFDKPVISPYTDWMKQTEALIQLGIDQGEIRSTIDPTVLARYIVPAFTGVQMVSNLLTGREDVMDRIDDMWAFLLPALLPKETDEETISALLLGGQQLNLP